MHDIFVFSSERKYELVERWRVEILGKFWNPEITFGKKKFYFEIIFGRVAGGHWLRVLALPFSLEKLFHL